MPAWSLRRWLFIVLLGLALFGLLAWAMVDRALGALPPFSAVRDAMTRRSPVLSAPLRWLRPAPDPLDLAGLATWRPAAGVPGEGVHHAVSSLEGLRAAMDAARGGDTIELAAGDYPLDEALRSRVDGWEHAPIRLRGQPGARLLLRQGVALDLQNAWWLVEDLRIEGRCAASAPCEAGVRVGGQADHVLLQRLQIQGLGVAVRVAGRDPHWPDHGAVLDSLFVLDAPTSGAVAGQALHLQGGSHWRFSGNRVFGVGKPLGDGAAYAVLAKGGGEGLLVERNLIVCSPQPMPGADAQLGIGLGGAGTPTRWLRDPDQRFEHQHARVVDNVVSNCSDAAIDLYRSRDILLQQNTLLASSGIVLRGAGSEAVLRRNLTSGAWYPQGGTQVSGGYNLRWVPDGRSLPDALKQARALPAPPGASQPAGADTRWLLP